MSGDYSCGPLNRIPWDVATEMKGLAWYAAWHAANYFAGREADCKRDKETADRHYANLCNMGMFSDHFCRMYKDMAWGAAWSTSSERMGTAEDAAKHKREWENCHKALSKGKEVTMRIADELKDLCWYSAWHATNKRTVLGLFTFRDAARDAERVDLHYNNIGADCKLVALDFISEKAKITETSEPKFFAQQKLENKSDCPQEMSVQFTHFTSQSKTWQHDVKWQFTVGGGVLDCFFNILGLYFASFSLGKTFSEGGAGVNGEVKTYTFPVKIGPSSAVEAKGVVQEAKAEVPYFMVFDIGGLRYCRSGKWTGVVAGNVSLVFLASYSLALDFRFLLAAGIFRFLDPGS